MEDIIVPPDTQFLEELHDELDSLIVDSAEYLMGPSVSFILEKPQLVSVEKCGNKSSLLFTVLVRAPGAAAREGLKVSLSVSMWRKV